MSTGNIAKAEYYPPEMRRAEHQPVHHATNVDQGERWLSLIAGGGLLAFGLSRRGLSGLGVAALGGGLLYRGLTGRCPMYEQLGIDTAHTEHSRAVGVRAGHGVKIERSIAINRPREELFRFWRDVGNLPQVMDHLLMVEVRDDRRSHWVAKGPMDTTLEWDAEIINERDGELIAWRSLDGGDVDTAGSVHFKPATGGRGTVVSVTLKYDPPGGRASARLAHFLGQGLEDDLDEDLRHFKQVMEAGEIPTASNRLSDRFSH